MAKVVVKDSKRKKLRDLKEALGTDLLRYIAELVTNSDDSYKREEENGNVPFDEPKPIYIEIKKHNNGEYSVIVTDNAEGMSEETLIEKFRTYDDDKAGGPSSKVRGIFGRGASDVLRASAHDNKVAVIKSVKDGEFTELRHDVNENGEYTIESKPIKIRSSQIDAMRNSLRIPKNGTQVTFGVHSKIKTNIKNIKELIEMYPAFHYLLDTPNRKIILIRNGRETVLSSNKYSFNNMELLSEETFDFDYEGYKLPCTLKMYRNPEKNQNNIKIMVIDENNAVYDNLMFDFANNVSANDISGELMVTGLYDITYDYINDEDKGISLFRENRTGFDTKKDFYVQFNKLISPKIDKTLKRYGNHTTTIDLSKNEKVANALQELNKYINQEFKEPIEGGNLGGNTPPRGGIEFIRNFISMTKGKSYDLKLLINPEMVLPSDEITISVTENDNIELNLDPITYNEREIRENGVVIKSLAIKALKKTVEGKEVIIRAACGSYVTTVIVAVIEEEIHYPANGFEFIKNEIEVVQNAKHKATLYFDKNIVPLGSIINFSSPGGIVLYVYHYTNSFNDLIDANIGRVDVNFAGGVLGKEYVITANVYTRNGPLEASVKIKIVDHKTSRIRGGGLFSTFKYAPDENISYQGAYDEHEKALIINISNPINKVFLGPFENIDLNKPKLNTAQRKYFCDVVSQIAARVLVDKKNVAKGDIKIEPNYEDEAFEQYLEYIRKQKTKMFNVLYKALVDESL